MDTYRTHLIVIVSVLSSAAVGRAAVIPCDVTLDVRAPARLAWSGAQQEAFWHEATRAWTSEGVRFCGRDATPCPSATTLYVRVVEEVPPGRAGEPPVLGWIGFSDRTGPGPLVLLSARWAETILGRAERGSRVLAELPGLVARLLPRALGRALAHELGHFLLGRRAHAVSGLMRASFRPEDLADEASGQRLGLTKADRRAVRASCGSRRDTLIASSQSTTPTSSR